MATITSHDTSKALRSRPDRARPRSSAGTDTSVRYRFETIG
ncbi:Uncharacterised protein [Mycobacterium tuberculosis]|nr:Uncharacterised protein [Mycobacterium tuberculosis]COY48805.1 Uncharacterised protein [Mycobacterium tuberculosis]